MLTAIFGRITSWLGDALFPLECIVCGACGAHCCRRCLVGLRLSERRLRVPAPLDAAWVAYPYAHPVVRRLIHDFKYQRFLVAEPALDALIARWALKFGGQIGDSGTIVVPVPLHVLKTRERGFNQSERLARLLCGHLGLAGPDTTLLLRTRRTRPQSDYDDDEDRRTNVSGAFRTGPGVALVGKTILLVDDVWTSGATMQACAAALKAAGTAKVLGFALAGTSFRQENRPTPHKTTLSTMH